LRYNSKYILIIIEFSYDSLFRFVPNSIRLAFLGLERGSPNIPKIIKELSNYDKEIIRPIHFSLIKRPEKIELSGNRNYKIKNLAVGAMILYEYLGEVKDLKDILNLLDQYIRTLRNNKKPKYFSCVTNHDFIVGNLWDYLSKTEKI
jgi:hypothetical protein